MLFRARGSRHVFFRHFVNDIVRHDIQGAVSFDPHYNTFLRQEFGLTLPRALQEFRFSPRCMYASGQRIFATEEECKATWRLSFNLLLDEVDAMLQCALSEGAVASVVVNHFRLACGRELCGAFVFCP